MEKIVYYNFYSENHKYSNNLAGFDLDSTLIKTKSGKTFPINNSDWVLLYDIIVEKFKTFNKQTVIIFSNQMGISKGHTNEEEILEKIKNIQKKINSPFIFIASKEDDIFRKPRIGMYEYIEKKINIQFDKKKSFYVGDMAGRKNDKTDSDRKFSLNLDIKFYTPEEYFLNKEPDAYDISGYKLDNNHKGTKINTDI